jgi:hypothetical protein
MAAIGGNDKSENDEGKEPELSEKLQVGAIRRDKEGADYYREEYQKNPAGYSEIMVHSDHCWYPRYLQRHIDNAINVWLDFLPDLVRLTRRPAFQCSELVPKSDAASPSVSPDAIHTGYEIRQSIELLSLGIDRFSKAHIGVILA